MEFQIQESFGWCRVHFMESANPFGGFRPHGEGTSKTVQYLLDGRSPPCEEEGEGGVGVEKKGGHPVLLDLSYSLKKNTASVVTVTSHRISSNKQKKWAFQVWVCFCPPHPSPPPPPLENVKCSFCLDSTHFWSFRSVFKNTVFSSLDDTYTHWW